MLLHPLDPGLVLIPLLRSSGCSWSILDILGTFISVFGGPTDVPSLVLGPLDAPSPFFGSYRCSFSISGGLTGGPSPFFGSLGWPRSVLDVLETLLLHFWILEMVFLSFSSRVVPSPLLGSSLGPRVVPSPFFGSSRCSFPIFWGSGVVPSLFEVLELFLLYFGVLESFLLHCLGPRVVPSLFFGS